MSLFLLAALAVASHRGASSPQAEEKPLLPLFPLSLDAGRFSMTPLDLRKAQERFGKKGVVVLHLEEADAAHLCTRLQMPSKTEKTEASSLSELVAEIGRVYLYDADSMPMASVFTELSEVVPVAHVDVKSNLGAFINCGGEGTTFTRDKQLVAPVSGGQNPVVWLDEELREGIFECDGGDDRAGSTRFNESHLVYQTTPGFIAVLGGYTDEHGLIRGQQADVRRLTRELRNLPGIQPATVQPLHRSPCSAGKSGVPRLSYLLEHLAAGANAMLSQRDLIQNATVFGGSGDLAMKTAII